MHVADQKLLSRLLDEHSAALVLYAQQWSGSPEDVVQDAFIQLMRQQTVAAKRCWLALPSRPQRSYQSIPLTRIVVRTMKQQPAPNVRHGSSRWMMTP